MFSLFLAVMLACVYWYLHRKDKRMLRNGIVLVAACCFGLFGITELLAQWFPWTEWITLGLVALTPLAVVVLAGFLITNGVIMIRREGRSLGNLLSLLAGIAILMLPLLVLLLAGTLNPFAIGLAALLFFLCSYFGVVFVVFLAYATVYGRTKHGAPPAAVVILGCQIIKGKVPPLLRSRLDKGLEVYAEAADTPPLLIPSGGQGPDESRPEGVAMAEYLVAAGALKCDVVAEDKARNTAENLVFSSSLAIEHERPGPIVVVTSNYHALRAALLTRKLGIDAEVVGAATARYFLPNAFLREFVAILQEHLKLHVLMCLPFLLMTAFLTSAIMVIKH